jgi:hypothetical protein
MICDCEMHRWKLCGEICDKIFVSATKKKLKPRKFLIMSNRILRNETLDTHAQADPGIQLAEMWEWS